MRTVTVGVGGSKHAVRVKVATVGEEEVNFKAEFDDLAAVAQTSGQPLKSVAAEANAVYLSSRDGPREV